jgi:hypothetical protein
MLRGFYSAPVRRHFNKFVTTLLGLLCTVSCFAQLDNRSFSDVPNWQPDAEGKLFLNVYNLGYMQNNEYFDSVADGYTLYGNQFYPRLSYYVLPNVRLDAGLFLRNDFGNTTWQETKPTVSVTVKYDSLTFIFGNLNGSLNHGLIQPMYNFEKVINNRLESGSQFIYKHSWFYGDLWIDWQATQYFGSNYHEKIWAGLSSTSTLLNNPLWTIYVPFQFTAYHNGGQLDTSKAPQFSQFTAASGLGIEKKATSNSFFKGWKFESHVLGQNSNNHILPNLWQQGGGFYSNFLLNTRVCNIMASYWYGHQYVNLKGGFQYLSVSNLYQPNSPLVLEGKQVTGTTFRNRNLFFIRFLKDFKLGEGICVSARMEPFYDMDSHLLEYNYGVFLNLNTNFFLGKVKTR